MQLSFCLPCMEEEKDELCFVSHPKQDRRLSCNIFGNIWMDQNWKGWEVWRFTKLEDNENKDDNGGDEEGGLFRITSWTHKDRVLCSNEEGKVYTTKNKEGSWEKWRIFLHPSSGETGNGYDGGGLVIQSVEHKRFLAFNGHDLYTARCDLRPQSHHWQEDAILWHLEAAHRNQFFISATCHDKCLTIPSASGFPCSACPKNKRDEKAKWTIQPSPDQVGQFTIQSIENHNYLGQSEDGVRITSSATAQKWHIVTSPHGGIHIQAAQDSSRKLSCGSNGYPYCSATNDDTAVVGSGWEDDTAVVGSGWEDTTWHLEAIMPPTISGKQIFSLVGIGVTTLTFMIATPFAVMGAVGAIGFGAEGIAAGSMAAGMMSAEAIASGTGAVAAGGTVATLQSIGAAGLGAGAATAAVGAGAAVGGATSLGVAAAINRDSGKGGKIQMKEPEKHFPLCSWRQWAVYL